MTERKRTNLSVSPPGPRAGGGAGGQPRAESAFGAQVFSRRKELGLTLQKLGDMVGCAKSFLWMLEKGQRSVDPHDPLVGKLSRALGYRNGELERALLWERTPRDVREAVQDLESKQRVARRLAEIIGGSGIDARGKVKGSLDEAHRSGELRALVERLTGEGSTAEAGARDEASGTRRGTEGVTYLSISGTPMRLPLEVPLINKVAAGYPREFTDLGYPARAAAEYVRSPGLSDPDAFACRVVGDSMLPEYREGDIVVFSPAKTIKSGMDCFARIEPDHETTFKRVYVEKDEAGHEVIRLQPLNPAYPARVLPREEVAGLYAAVSVTREVG